MVAAGATTPREPPSPTPEESLTPVAEKHLVGQSAVTPKAGSVTFLFSGDDDEHSAGTEASQDSESKKKKEREVPYGSGATVLFKAIEDTDWDTALKECNENPGDARIWVKSSGTENTVFNWSVWKRLPLHEACRRQPPAILVATLLSIHPEAAMATTHFGELPIHLAVGCGASPDIVNLLIAANFLGVVVRDNGGRTPLEVLQENGEVRADSELIVQSLELSMKVHARYESDWKSQMRHSQREHDQALVKVQRDHERALARKDEEIGGLEKEVLKGKADAADLSSQIDEFEVKVTNKNAAERVLMDRVRELEDEIADLRSQKRGVLKSVQELEDSKLQDQKHIQTLKLEVAELHSDIANINAEQEKIVCQTMARAEADLRSMMDSQKKFMRRVAGHREGVRQMMMERGIALPKDSPSPQTPSRKAPKGLSGKSPSTKSPSSTKKSEGRVTAAAKAAAAAADALSANSPPTE